MNAEQDPPDDQDGLDPWYSRTGFNYSEKVQKLRDRLYDESDKLIRNEDSIPFGTRYSVRMS